MKPNVNSIEVHPQLSNNGHPVLVCWWVLAHCGPFYALLLASKTSCDYKEFAFSMTFMGQQFEITIVLLLSKSA
jgi:hypothetical protein